MMGIEQRFTAYVFTPSGEDAFDFELKREVSKNEKTLLDAIEDGGVPLVDNEELAILYTQIESQAYEIAIQMFWDKNPDASDDAFNDYQVVVDI